MSFGKLGSLGRGFGRLGGRLGGASGGGTPPVTVGGAVVGQPGSGFYAGYTLSWGDDFDGALDIVGPATPKGKYLTTKGYTVGPRGNTSTLGTMYDVDPLFTGYNDSNRGAAVGFDNMAVGSSRLLLQSRKALPAEVAHLAPTDPAINGGVRNEIAATITTAGAIVYYPDTNAVIVEAKIKWSSKVTNPHGWHPSFWAASVEPLRIDANTGTGANEWDIAEGHALSASFTKHLWTTTSGSTTYGSLGANLFDAAYHTVTCILRDGGDVELWVDGALLFHPTTDANIKDKAQYLLFTSHIYNGDFGDGGYDKAAWDAFAAGAQMEIDWIRVWRTTGANHYTALATVPDLNVSFNGSGTIVIPAAVTLWGGAPTSEDVSAFPNETNEPGMSETASYGASSPFPPGVTYNSGTRTITADFSAVPGKAGRIHLRALAKSNGSTCEPARFTINRGPQILTPTIPITVGAPLSYDLYAQCDCGNILPKTVSVTGLPSGLSYSAITGLVTGTPTATGTASVTVTNGAGQVLIQNVDFWQPSAASGLVFYFDTTNAVATPDDGAGKVMTLCDVYDNTKCIAQTTSGARPAISNVGGPFANKRVMTFSAQNLRSDDAAATNASTFTGFMDTADVRTGDRYIVFATKENAISTINRVMGWYNALASQIAHFRYTATGKGFTITGAGGAAQNCDYASQDTSWHVYEVIKTGAAVVLKQDGTQVATLTITQTGGITGTMMLVGANNSGGAVASGFVGALGGAFIGYNVMPSTADQNFARRLAGWKIGVTVI